MRYCFLFLLSLLAISHQVQAQSPETEVRAVWLTTNWALDWPKKGKTVKEQKQELIAILDKLEENNFNMVLFQVRAQGRVFYDSDIEAKSPYYNNSFDPLAFAIEECHIRGMECHAWMVAFPNERIRYSGKGRNRKIVNTKPSYFLEADGYWVMDPGREETATYLQRLTKELVQNYNIDGIHLDYIRYPDNPKKFKDGATYKQFGKGKSLDQWRTDNVTRVVYGIYDTVKEIKPWVQVSSSPIGKYRMLVDVKSNDTWTAKEAVHQDAAQWLKDGKHDMLFPMMYYQGNDFYPFVEDWLTHSNNRPIIPGIGAYKLGEEKKEWSWTLDIVTDEMTFLREKTTAGQAYFRAEHIVLNKKGLLDSISAFYKLPAKLPPLTWLSDSIPPTPTDLEIYKNEDNNLTIAWKAMGDDYTYTIYVSTQDEVDTTNPKRIIQTRQQGNEISIPMVYREVDYGLYYTVTATDRYRNESIPMTSGFYVYSKEAY